MGLCFHSPEGLVLWQVCLSLHLLITSLWRCVATQKEYGIIVHDMNVNSLVTTMEMAGASISMMRTDEDLLTYYDMPSDGPYYKK